MEHESVLMLTRAFMEIEVTVTAATGMMRKWVTNDVTAREVGGGDDEVRLDHSILSFYAEVWDETSKYVRTCPPLYMHSFMWRRIPLSI